MGVSYFWGTPPSRFHFKAPLKFLEFIKREQIEGYSQVISQPPGAFNFKIWNMELRMTKIDISTKCEGRSIDKEKIYWFCFSVAMLFLYFKYF